MATNAFYAGNVTIGNDLSVGQQVGVGGDMYVGGYVNISGGLYATSVNFQIPTAGVTSISAGGVTDLSGTVQFVGGTNLSIGGTTSPTSTVTIDLSGIGNPMPTNLDMSGNSIYSSTGNVTVSGNVFIQDSNYQIYAQSGSGAQLVFLVSSDYYITHAHGITSPITSFFSSSTGAQVNGTLTTSNIYSAGNLNISASSFTVCGANVVTGNVVTSISFYCKSFVWLWYIH